MTESKRITLWAPVICLAGLASVSQPSCQCPHNGGASRQPDTKEDLLRHMSQAERELTHHENKVLRMEEKMFRDKPVVKEYRKRWRKAFADLNECSVFDKRLLKAAAGDVENFVERHQSIMFSQIFLLILRRLEDPEEAALVREYLTKASEEMRNRGDVGGAAEDLQRIAAETKKRLATLLAIDEDRLQEPDAFWAVLKDRLPSHKESIEESIESEKRAAGLREEHLGWIEKQATHAFDAAEFFTLEYVLRPPELVTEIDEVNRLAGKYGVMLTDFREKYSREEWPAARDEPGVPPF